jgi:hypothetical protein
VADVQRARKSRLLVATGLLIVLQALGVAIRFRWFETFALVQEREFMGLAFQIYSETRPNKNIRTGP